MLVVLVFDSVSIQVLERMLGEGRLPALAQLRARGRWHSLAASAASVDTGHFTLYAGLPLQEHGLHYLFQWDEAEQRIKYVHDFATPAGFWEPVGESGLVIDPYECWSPRSGDVVFLRGFQFRERLVLPPPERPGEEWRRLTRRHGPPPRIDDLYGRPSVDRLRRLRAVLTGTPGRAAAAVADVLARRSLDLVFVGFGSAHLGGHHFWDLSQLSERERPRARDAGLETALDDIYAAVDAAIATIVDALPADADLLVVSPSGMGPNTSRGDLLPSMLRGVLDGGTGSAAPGDSIWRLRGSVPTSLRAGVARALPDSAVRRLTAGINLHGVDWSRTRAFALPGDYRGFVRLNLRGRERAGIVGGREHDGLLEEVAEGLSSFCDPDGAPAVASVERIESLVPDGPERHRLPDLVVRWSDRPATSLAGLHSPRFGDVHRVGVGTGRPGNHTEDGWILAVPGGGRARDPAGPPGLADVAATAAALLGRPRAAPGEPLLEPA